MQRTEDVLLICLTTRAFQRGLGLHGELGLELKEYECTLVSIANKRLGDRPARDAILAFFNTLHTSDLYLSGACANQNDRGWTRFSTLYGKCISNVARSVSHTRCAAADLAEGVLAHIFLPDKSGRSRIASYDGRSSLATWLSAIICHKAVNERERKSNSFERLEDLPEIADCSVVRRIERKVRGEKFELAIKESIVGASKTLTERERFVLALRFREHLQGSEIAAILRVHPSTVTRQVQQTCEKLRYQVITMLASRHHLDPSTIAECLSDTLDNPSYSVISLLTEGNCSPEQALVAGRRTQSEKQGNLPPRAGQQA